MKFLICFLILIQAVVSLGLDRQQTGADHAVASPPFPGDTSQEPRRYSYEIIRKIPSDPHAFIQGFIVYDNRFLIGTGGDRHSSPIVGRQSSIRIADISTGRIMAMEMLENLYFGEGITVFNNRLYQLTWRNRLAFVYSADGLNLREPVKTFRYSSEGWGLTHDEKNLIMSDGTPRLQFIDPDDFRLIRTVSVSDRSTPVYHLNELEYVNGEIFANIYMKDQVARICPDTGRVTGWIDFSGLHTRSASLGGQDVLNGIAYDQARDKLYVTGKLWDFIYEVKITTGNP
ncbi:MAG: glutaminyl-peptide cyclotransferase [Pseudomonadota bacterium]